MAEENKEKNLAQNAEKKEEKVVEQSTKKKEENVKTEAETKKEQNNTTAKNTENENKKEQNKESNKEPVKKFEQVKKVETNQNNAKIKKENVKKDKKAKPKKENKGMVVRILVIAIILLLIIALIYLAMKTPEKALTSMLKDLKSGDIEGVNQYVNFEEISLKSALDMTESEEFSEKDKAFYESLEWDVKSVKKENELPKGFKVINNFKDEYKYIINNNKDILTRLLKCDIILSSNEEMMSFDVLFSYGTLTILYNGENKKDNKELLLKQKDSLEKSIVRRQKLLSNPGYVNKAPENIVLNERKKLSEEQNELKTILDKIN